MSQTYAKLLRPKISKNYIAQKYAQAFINVMQSNQKVTEDLILRFLAVHQFFKLHKFFFINFFIKKTNSENSLLKLKQILNLDDFDLKLLRLLVARKNFFYLPEICKYIIKLAAKLRGEKIFAVSTSDQINQDEKDLIFKFLINKINEKPLIIFSVDRELISGIRIEADCFLYEKSIKSRLKKAIITLRSIAK